MDDFIAIVRITWNGQCGGNEGSGGNEAFKVFRPRVDSMESIDGLGGNKVPRGYRQPEETVGSKVPRCIG